MRRDEWKRVDDLFAAALERESGERAAYLDAACAGDASLRREVDRLLTLERGAPGLLDEPAAVLAAALLTRDEPLPDDPSASIDEARFVPGDVVAGRYRIVGLLGRGGMGEVYRADDLTLRQPAALKFLPARLASRPEALARMRREVSLARQIAHRHVCRVYDVGEDRGLHFLSMELVRGEDLGSLLRRVGRLTPERATDVARQLCAGLGAIHERGVLHRDLKPANVLVDERGDVRIADFGLAALADDVRGEEIRAGTPAYMSPEQLAGAPLTVRSDLYSLGLVLYELFTGRRAFEASSRLDELIERRGVAPPSPSSLVDGLDRLAERAIMACLDSEPERRPDSAHAVAVALSGGDPLAAALAVGEIPSPEAVAAAPRPGALGPRAAAGLALVFAGALACACALSGSTMLHRRAPLARSTEVLEAKADEVLARLGVAGVAGDSARGFAVRAGALDATTERPEALAAAEPPVLIFWYRRSPSTLDAGAIGGLHAPRPLAGPAGAADVTLDTRGRLRSFSVVPSRALEPGPAVAPVDWTPAFADAGLDVARFAPAEPVRVPERFADARFAWTGAYPERPDVAVRVEAASLAGRPVAFEVLDPSDLAEAAAAPGGSAGAVVLVAVFLAALGGSLVLAARNLRAGRGDRRGAMRLALFVSGAMAVRWAVSSHHVPALAELGSFVEGFGLALALGAFVWLVYVALEPFVRRRWPDLLVSWSRLLAGGVRDPLVGRHALLGLAAGAVTVVCLLAGSRTPAWLGLTPAPPIVEPGSVMLGIGRFPEALVQQLVGSVVQALHALFVIVLVAALTRRRDLAAAACWLIAFAVLGPLGNPESPADWWSAAAVAALLVGVLARFGLLALIAALFVVHTYVFYPITTDLTAWYAGSFVAELLVLATLAAWAASVAVAGGRSTTEAFKHSR